MGAITYWIVPVFSLADKEQTPEPETKPDGSIPAELRVPARCSIGSANPLQQEFDVASVTLLEDVALDIEKAVF